MTYRDRIVLGAKRIASHGTLVATVMALTAIWVVMFALHRSVLDTSLLMRWRASSPNVARLAEAVTKLGFWNVSQVVMVGVILLLLSLRRLVPAALFPALVYSGHAAVRLQKVMIGYSRPNPHLWLTRVNAATFTAGRHAFPSGHAAVSMCVYFGASLLLTRLGAHWRWLIVASLILSLIIGVSRLVLAVHWTSDVVGGWAFGALWALLWALLILAIEVRADARRMTATRRLMENRTR